MIRREGSTQAESLSDAKGGALHADETNLERLPAALEALRADVSAVPPLSLDPPEAGTGTHATPLTERLAEG